MIELVSGRVYSHAGGSCILYPWCYKLLRDPAQFSHPQYPCKTISKGYYVLCPDFCLTEARWWLQLKVRKSINLHYTTYYALKETRRAFINYKKNPTGHNLPKTHSPFSLRPPCPPPYTLQHNFYKHHTDGRQTQHIKGKDSNYRLLPKYIVCKITRRNNIRRATCAPAFKLLNEGITSNIHKHKQNIWKEYVDALWDNRHNAHTLWKTIHGISNREPQPTLNTSTTFNNKITTTQTNIAKCFTKQSTNTVRHTK